MFWHYVFNWLLHWTWKINLFFTIKFVCCFSSDKGLNMLLGSFFFSILLSALLNLLLCTQILCENNHFRSYWFLSLIFCLVEICSLNTCWKLFVSVLLYYFCERILSLLILNFIQFYYWAHITFYVSLVCLKDSRFPILGCICCYGGW
jgi:hypothetical protein